MKKTSNLIRIAVVPLTLIFTLVGCSVVDNPADCVTGDACGAGYACNMTTHACAPVNPDGTFVCAQSAECPMEKPSCIAGQCSLCTAAQADQQDMQCKSRGLASANICANDGLCKECRVNADCDSKGLKPSCDTATNTCRVCRQHADCDSGICVLDESMISDNMQVGQCVSKDKVARVDNKAAACGSKGPIYCEITQALEDSKNYVAITGSKTAYQKVRLTGGKVVLIGPGRDATTTAIVKGLAVSSNSSAVAEGLVFQTETMDTQAAVSCTNALAELIVRNSIVESTPSNSGLIASPCKQLILESSLIRRNFLSGIVVNNAAYRIINNLVFGNGVMSSNNPAVTLGGGTTGTFAFNNVLYNGPQATGEQSGVSCGNNNLVKDSIIYGNSSMPNMSNQFTGNCKFERVVVNPQETSMAMGLLKSEPNLSGAYTLTKDSTVCIDQAMVDATITKDYYGILRPQGKGYDIGFNEYKP